VGSSRNPSVGAKLEWRLVTGSWNAIDFKTALCTQNSRRAKPDMRFVAWVNAGQSRINRDGRQRMAFRMVVAARKNRTPAEPIVSSSLTHPVCFPPDLKNDRSSIVLAAPDDWFPLLADDGQLFTAKRYRRVRFVFRRGPVGFLKPIR
jgi:hypothetical protein